MQELLTVFEREGDADLMRQRIRADNTRKIKAITVALWRRAVLLVAAEPRGHFTPAR